MDKIKKLFIGLGAILLAVVAFLAGSKGFEPVDDTELVEEQEKLEEQLAEVNKNGVEAEELTYAEVVDFWKK